MDATPSRPKRLVVCLDGTWNNAAKSAERDDGDQVYKPSNVLKTARAVTALDDVVATLWLSGLPLDGESITFDQATYVFRDAPREPQEVAIGQTPKACLRNFRRALERSEPRPPVYGRPVLLEPNALELARRSGTPDEPSRFCSTLTHGTWLTKNAILDATREQGLDPRPGIPQVAYYDAGVGGLRALQGWANRVHREMDRVFGGIAGLGLEGNVEDAFLFLCLNHQPGDEIFLFGFSRGAASARSLARFVEWMGGLLPASDCYWLPRYFDAFLAGGDARRVRQEIFHQVLQQKLETIGRKKLDPAVAERRTQAAIQKAKQTVGSVTPVRIRFLGVWDTVLSLSSRRRERPHLGPSPPAIVDHARQALAVDERRSDFLPWPWNHPAHESGEGSEQTLEQRWFPGVHTNVGGGYVHDGLANVPLRWLLREARRAGLGIDWDFLRFYRPYPQDRLYDSAQGLWKFRRMMGSKKGERQIFVSEWLQLDPSIFHRLASVPDADEHPRLELYRPPNLLRFLAQYDDHQLERLLRSVPGLSTDYRLPNDVLETIERLRRENP